MAKQKNQFLCTECGDNFTTFFGKCPSCGAFNALKEFKESKLQSDGTPFSGQDLTATDTIQSPTESKSRLTSDMGEVDRVLGEGFFPGSVVLFGGQPGIGKSTLALQIFAKLSHKAKAFYFSGEESVDQVANRAERLTKTKSKDYIFATNSLEDIVQTVQTQSPDFIVVDSIQMIGLEGSSFGSMSQIRENAEVLVKLAKTTGTTILLIGHVTKADELAGPKILEHLVDVVLSLEGEKNSEIRLLRSPKNRFGSTLEVGVFEMASTGLTQLLNPSEYFLAERAENAFGNAICVVREGVRNFCMEIQVLTVKTNFGNPRRTASGLSMSKFHLLLAVISKFTPYACDQFDAYLNVVGGFRVQDPASDLAICAAIISSRSETEIGADTIIFGEVGLSGEVRRVPNMDARLMEAEKLGFKKIICPRMPKNTDAPKNLQVIEVKNVGDLLKAVVQG